MDFSKLVGKTVLWTDTRKNEEDCVNTYVLFSDKTLLFIPDPESGEEESFIDDAYGTLVTMFRENIAAAAAIVALGLLLFDEGAIKDDDASMEILRNSLFGYNEQDDYSEDIDGITADGHTEGVAEQAPETGSHGESSDAGQQVVLPG